MKGKDVGNPQEVVYIIRIHTKGGRCRKAYTAAGPSCFPGLNVLRVVPERESQSSIFLASGCAVLGIKHISIIRVIPARIKVRPKIV
jgi:hypothetical protein